MRDCGADDCTGDGARSDGRARRRTADDMHPPMWRHVRLARVEAGLIDRPAVALVLVAVLLLGGDLRVMPRDRSRQWCQAAVVEAAAAGQQGPTRNRLPRAVPAASMHTALSSGHHSARTRGVSTMCSARNQTCCSFLRITSLTSRSLVPSSPCSEACRAIVRASRSTIW